MAALADTDLVDLPDPDAPGLEGDLGRANQRRLAHATAEVERVLPGLVAWLSSNRVAGDPPHRIFAIPPVNAAAVQAVVDTVLRHDDARGGRLTLDLSAAPGVDDALAFDTTYEVHRPLLGQLAAKLADGAAVTVRAVGAHLDPLDRLSGHLDTVVGRPCEIDVVVLGPGASHRDPADRGGEVVLVPLDVALTATATEPTPPDADRARTPDRARDATDRTDPTDPRSLAAGAIANDADRSGPAVTVAPGQAVVAAAGRDLVVRAVEPVEPDRTRSPGFGAGPTTGPGTGTAMALRIVLPLVSAPALLRAAAANARFHPLLRADLPTDLSGVVESYDGSLWDRAGAFGAETATALGPTSQRHAAALARALVPPRPRNGLLAARAARRHGLPPLVSPITGGVLVTRRGPDVALVASGRVYTLHPDLAAALAPHLDGLPFDPTALVAGLAHLDEPPAADAEPGQPVPAAPESPTSDSPGTSTASESESSGPAAGTPVPAERPVVAALHRLLALEVLAVAP